MGSYVSSTEELNAEYDAALEDNKGSFSSEEKEIGGGILSGDQQDANGKRYRNSERGAKRPNQGEMTNDGAEEDYTWNEYQ